MHFAGHFGKDLQIASVAEGNPSSLLFVVFAGTKFFHSEKVLSSHATRGTSVAWYKTFRFPLNEHGNGEYLSHKEYIIFIAYKFLSSSNSAC